MKFVTSLKTAISDPQLAADYALYRAGFNTVRTEFGGKLKGSTYSEFRSIRNLALSANELRLFDLIPNTGNIFDVGAHVGIWTVPLALARPNATVHAFEGAHPTFQQFTKNLHANGLTNVRANHSAVYDKTGTIAFQIPENASVFGRVATSGDSEGRYTHSREITSPCITLEDYCKRHGIETIDFLKIDVEGAELHVLRGLGRLLTERRVSYIWTELDPDITNRTNVQQLIQQCGYTFCRGSKPVDIRLDCDGNMLVRQI